ncbi:MAG TPA: FtsX-like permease family protein [Rhodanobacter sp.]|nr:FtsX-like permease family protein [Rhodanobacter sp.]
MSVRHIVSSLRRNQLMPLLVVVQVAIACAILCNAFFLLDQRLAPMLVPDGIAPGQVIEVDQIVANGRSWSQADIQGGRQALLAIPGVTQVAPAMGIPLSSSMRLGMGLTSPAGVTVTADGYLGEGMLDALGLQLVAGRNFSASDYEDFNMQNGDPFKGKQIPIIITRALATKLFPDGNALGGRLRGSNARASGGWRVIGIVSHLLRYQIADATDGRADYSMLIPARITDTPLISYVVRTRASEREQVLKAIPGALKKQFGSSLLSGNDINPNTFEGLREAVFSSWRAAVWLLASVCVVVVLVTAMGIMGLTGYWVQQRTRQVGIRRALGARRVDILRYFLLENLLIVGIGILAGMVLAYGINLFLMHHYELQRLPWTWLPVGAVALFVLGQLAVLSPARRAAAVPPVVATRSV